jgi:hypothetical protein
MLQSAAAKALAGLVAAILLFVGGFLLGHHYGGNAETVKCQSAEIKAQTNVIHQDAKVATAAATQASDAQAIGVQVTTATEQIHEVTHRVIVKVPVYVPAAADAGCNINAGFVRLWNAANVGTDPAEQPADSGSGQQPASESAGAGKLSAAPAFSFPAASGVGPAGDAQ